MIGRFPIRPKQPTMDEVELGEFRERATIPAPAVDEKRERIERWHTLYAAFDRLDPDRQIDAKVIVANLAHMGKQAAAFTVEFSEGQRNGAIVYGSDFDDDRDFVKEAFAEARDGCAYSRAVLRKYPGDPIAEAMLSAFETAGKLALVLVEREQAAQAAE